MEQRGQVAGKEVLFQSPYFSWERVTTDSKGVYVQNFKMNDRWVILATDKTGRNYLQDCGREDECYRLIEDAYPVTRIIGSRHDGAVEIIEASQAFTM
jgi:hypothetical protein